MFRLPGLLSILTALAASVAPLSGCVPTSCPEAEQEVVVIDRDSEALVDELARCEADATDCDALCRKVYALVHDPGQAQYVEFTECGVTELEGDTAVFFTANRQCIGGRRPATAQFREGCESLTEVGAWFAKLAELEESSIYAFLGLVRELEHLGAPTELVAAARAAAADEVVHTQLVHTLATRYGARAQAAQVAELPERRSALELAIDNAREGCVRETFGALLAVFQSQHSEDPVVRAAMRRIAEDESRHAELSRRLDGWLRSLLSEAERRRVDLAQDREIDALQTDAGQPLSDELRRATGLPAPAQTRSLLGAAREALWS